MKPKEILELEEYYGIELNPVKKLSNIDNLDYQNIYFVDDNNQLIGLNISATGISDLDPIKELFNLHNLNLSSNKISDLNPIKVLKNLQYLNLLSNEIKDLNPIKDLINLQSLVLNDNKISDLNPIKDLKNLHTLELSYNQISDLKPIKDLRNLISIEFLNNKISDLSTIKDLINLKNLELSNNLISDLNPIKGLMNLHSISLLRNHITDLNPIKDLKNLQNLEISYNNISDLSPIKGLIKLKSLGLSVNKNLDLNLIKDLINLQYLDLSNNQISDLNLIKDLINLQYLDLSNNQISDLNPIKGLTNLQNLDLSYNKISDLNTIRNLSNLESLNLFDNEILDINAIIDLNNLKYLNLSYNPINDISLLQKLIKLEKLEIESCKIYDIQFIKHLIKIKNLNLGGNLISNIDSLKDLYNLENINLSNNSIQTISSLFIILNLQSLIFIDIYNNPFLDKTDLKINYGRNHLQDIKSYLLRQQETNKLTIKLPAKVLFLGNHASGKSTFLDYFVKEDDQKQINEKQKSTHILQILQFKKEKTNLNLPNAIIFDFGGQDYYHGIYKAFLTNNAINLLFFKSIIDRNLKIPDREDVKKQTYSFTRDYWIHQINYYNSLETISLIQTHADLDSRSNFQNNCSGIHIDHEFYIALNNVALKKNSNLLSLKYLVAVLNEKIEEHRKDINEPLWYIEFLNYIMNYTKANAINISEIKKHYKREISDDYLFISDLKQLCEQGLILYYPEKEKINHIAWLNPTATIYHIHNDILTKKVLKEYNGIIKKDEFEYNVKKQEIIELLKVHKVIFLDETDIDNPVYIIPGYLENAKDKNEAYFMLSDFDDPSFVLKFEYFIPFGFMNQLICKYGGNPDKKLYWKDQLLFTYENNARILIQLDFEQLEIKVFIKLKKNSKIDDLEISKMIFKDIINIYYDKVDDNKETEKITNKVYNNADEHEYEKLNIFSENNKQEYPNDLYISVDGDYFVHFVTLNDDTLTKSEILGYSKDVNGKLDKSKGRTLSSIKYKSFTINKNIQKMKKIFISYSRKDDDFKNKLRDHLDFFKHFDIADNWSCEDITIGNWDSQIQQQLEESDLIIYMLSVNFFKSKYIREKEVLKGFELIDKNKEKEILCIIVDYFIDLDKLKIPIENRTPLQDSLLRLSEKQYLPYDKIKSNNEVKIVPLQDFANQNRINEALTQITDKVLEFLKL